MATCCESRSHHHTLISYTSWIAQWMFKVGCCCCYVLFFLRFVPMSISWLSGMFQVHGSEQLGVYLCMCRTITEFNAYNELPQHETIFFCISNRLSYHVFVAFPNALRSRHIHFDHLRLNWCAGWNFYFSPYASLKIHANYLRSLQFGLTALCPRLFFLSIVQLFFGRDFSRN